MDCHEKHYAEFNEKPQYTAKIPGIVSLFGFYARQYNGVSITAADGRDIYVCASKSEKNQIVAFNSSTGDRKRIGLSSFKYRREDRWANFIKGTFYAVQQIKKIENPAMNITLCGENLEADDSICGPMIALGTALILNESESLELSDEKLVKIVSSSCSFCNCDVDYGRITTLVTAKNGHFLCYDYSTGSYSFIKSPFDDGQFRLLCIDSNVPAYTMKDEISRMHSTVCEVVSAYAEHYPHRKINTLSDLELNDRAIDLDEDSRRVGVFLKDDGTLASSTKKAMLANDMSQICRNIAKFGRELRDDVYLTCPELDWIAKRATEQEPQTSSSNLFAGTGSMLCVFTEASNVEAVKAKLSDYNHIFGFDLSIEEFNPAGKASLT